jgi:hypothetical protein
MDICYMRTENQGYLWVAGPSLAEHLKNQTFQGRWKTRRFDRIAFRRVTLRHRELV